MRDVQTIINAYRTLIGAVCELPPGDFHMEDTLRMEGAADALNWVLQLDEQLSSVFEDNIERLKEQGKMHDCPECHQACDCDCEDTWNDAAAEDCCHECEEEDDEFLL